jgi:hypothetical protein
MVCICKFVTKKWFKTGVGTRVLCPVKIVVARL